MMKRLAIKVCILERHLFLCDLYVWIHLYQIDMKQDRKSMTLYKNHMPVQNREKLNVRTNYNVNHLRRSLIYSFLLKGYKLYQLFNGDQYNGHKQQFYINKDGLLYK